MNNGPAPQPRMDIPNYTNYQPGEELVRLRKRVNDLLKLGAATPETFAQTMMQLWQEGERRRQACMQEADEHLRKYHALVAQAHGFAAQSSILYSVINGYATLEERRVQEMIEREKETIEKEKAQEEARKAEEARAKGEAPQAAPANGHPAHEGAGVTEVGASVVPKPSGGKRKKP